jgi:hypothetical protein
MAYVQTSGSLEHGHSRLSAFFAECGNFFAMLGASLRVARAVENHRQAAPSDLNLLGIRHPLPGNY